MSTLDTNLAAFSSRQPRAAGQIRGATTDPQVVLRRSRSGLPVPAIVVAGREVCLHSRYDPLREAERLFEAGPTGFVVSFGLGAAHHLRRFLASPDTFAVVVVEPRSGRVRSLLERIDLTDVLADGRVTLLVEPTPHDIHRAVLDLYLPALAGALRSISLEPVVREDPDFHRAAAVALRDAVERTLDDLATQRRFGRRWFAHTLANLALAEASPAAAPRHPTVLIAAAGPSLELNRRLLLHAPGPILATDTSLPALLSHGVQPSVAVTVDCQQVGYHHFLKGVPADTLLALDLASPPTIARTTCRRLFLATAHPFSAYLAGGWRPFPAIDTSGGNVTHAAVSLALGAGAREIHLVGADFAYPLGDPYARGCYLDPYFRARECRLSPYQSALLGFVYDRPGVSRVVRSGQPVYTTALMDRYRNRLDVFGEWEREGPGYLVLRSDGQSPAPPTEAAAGNWRSFLATYRRNLVALPEPPAPLHAHWRGLSLAERRLWLTILPACRGGLSPTRALLDARAWSVEKLSRTIGSV